MTPQLLSMLAVPIFRAAGFLMTSPFFRLQAVPKVARLTLAFSLAICVWLASAQAAAGNVRPTTSWVDVGMMAVWESLVGLLLGSLCTLVFLPLRFLAGVLSEGLGINLASVVDPSQPDQGSVLADMLEMLAMAIFFAGDFHLHTLSILVHIMRFEHATPDWAAVVAQTEVSTFIAAHKLGLALSGVLFAGFLLSSLAAMLVNRASPTMNFFSVGQGMRSAFGIVMLAILIPSIAQGVEVLWKQSLQLLVYLIPMSA